MSTFTSTSLTLRALLKTAAGRTGLGVPGRPVGRVTSLRHSPTLGRALGLAWVYYPNTVHPLNNRDFGCAILSRFPYNRVMAA